MGTWVACATAVRDCLLQHRQAYARGMWSDIMFRVPLQAQTLKAQKIVSQFSPRGVDQFPLHPTRHVVPREGARTSMKIEQFSGEVQDRVQKGQGCRTAAAGDVRLVARRLAKKRSHCDSAGVWGVG